MNLGSKLAIGTFFSFVGYKHVSIELMQTLCHSTRAYIVKEEGLRGFVFKMDIIKILKEADAKGKLVEVRKWQVIGFDELEKELDGL